MTPTAQYYEIERCTLEAPRKGYIDDMRPDGEGWKKDYSRGRPGEAWDRFDFHEEAYWIRYVPIVAAIHTDEAGRDYLATSGSPYASLATTQWHMHDIDAAWTLARYEDMLFNTQKEEIRPDTIYSLSASQLLTMADRIRAETLDTLTRSIAMALPHLEEISAVARPEASLHPAWQAGLKLGHQNLYHHMLHITKLAQDKLK